MNKQEVINKTKEYLIEKGFDVNLFSEFECDYLSRHYTVSFKSNIIRITNSGSLRIYAINPECNYVLYSLEFDKKR